MRYASVVELRRNRLVAAWGGKRPGWIDEAIPEDLGDEARGEWLKAAFKDSGMPSGKVLLVLPRREAVLLQIEIEAPEGASTADLHGMARVRLGTQSTIDAHKSVMDVVRTAGTSYTVCAVPGDVADRTREELKSSGRAIAGMTTRSAGLGVMADDACVHMVIIAGEAEVVLAVVRAGVPILTRQLNRNGDMENDAAKIVSEAHRADTSVRMLSGIEPIEKIVLHSDGPIGAELSKLIAEQLTIPIVKYEPSVRGMPAELWPLMAIAQSGGDPVLLLRRVMPARGLEVPAIRIGLGLGALAAIVLIGAVVFLSGQKATLRKRVSSLRNELVQLQSKNRAHLREEARLIHLQNWIGQEPNWTDEIASITEILPERGVVVDRLVGTESREVSFSAARSGQGRRYEGGNWKNAELTEIDLHASVDDRHLVQDLRQRLIDDPRFDVESKGPELPDRLVFRVTVTPEQSSAHDKSEEQPQ